MTMTRATKTGNVTENNVKLLKALLTGKYMAFSMRMEKRTRFEKDTGMSDPANPVRKLEKMGIIVGYIPVLSEEGGRLVRTLDAFFSRNGKKPGEAQTPLVEVIGDSEKKE